MIEFFVGLVGGTLAFWLFGGLLARLGGPLLVLAGASDMGINGGAATRILAVVVGTLLWLVGHWHYALRHREYKNQLARYVFRYSIPTCLDPTGDWAAIARAKPSATSLGDDGRQ